MRGFTPDRDIGGSYSGERAVCVWCVCVMCGCDVCVWCVCVMCVVCMCVSGEGKEWA